MCAVTLGESFQKRLAPI